MPRKARFDDVEVKCPFFKRGNDDEIICEGIEKGTVVKQEFYNRANKRIYKKAYCDKQYCRCKLYQMLMEKYE